MKKWTVLFVIFSASAISSPTVYEGYEDFYTSRFDSIFSIERSMELQVTDVSSSGELVLKGDATLDKKAQHVKVVKGRVAWNEKIYKFSDAKTFKGVVSNAEDLGRGTRYFFASNAACLENVPSASAGTAVRHKSVYLIAPAKGSTSEVFIKLPSLFASCLAVSKDTSGNFRFPSASYRYAENELDAEGLDFKTYVYKSRKFKATTDIKSIRFVDKENLYKFIELGNGALSESPLPVQMQTSRCVGNASVSKSPAKSTVAEAMPCERPRVALSIRSLRTTGVGHLSPGFEHSEHPCSQFKLARSQIRQYMGSAGRVTKNDMQYVVDESACVVSGVVKFSNGKAYKFSIGELRDGKLVDSSDEIEYLYCSKCQSPPFAQ